MDKISLKRIRLLLFNTESFVGQTQKRVIPFTMLLLPVFLAWFLVWLDYFDGFLLSIMYMMTSYIAFLPLNENKGKEINYLMFPASTAEKIIAHIIQAIAIPTIMLMITIPAVILIQGLINLRAGESMLSYMPVFEMVTVNNFFIGFLLQAMFGFACLTFRKWTMIKGLMVVLPIICIILAVKTLLNKEGLMEGIIVYLFNGILLCLTVLVWIANYYKLKKREI
jgi:hypothetical protein